MVPYVREMAQRFGASVTVLNAVNIGPNYVLGPRFDPECQSGPVEVPYTADFQKLREERHARLRDFAREQLGVAHFTAKVMDGEPASVIEWVAEREEIDLIMMPTHGLGKLRRLLVGSVTAKVLHDVSCPVFTGVHEAVDALPPAGGYDSIVCAVDLDQEADTILGAAAFFARAYGSRVCIVHAGPTAPRDKRSATERLRRALPAIMADTPVTISVREAAVAESVRECALEEAADLVVAGRGHQQGDLSRLWSQLYAIVRESPCPVVSV
jgi:nucleotide-binding universal stress UspA family protein